MPLSLFFSWCCMSKFGSTLTVALTSEQAACFEEMAKSAGFMWGRCGNISAFLRAVADGYFIIIPADHIPFDGDQDCSVVSDSLALIVPGDRS